MKKIGILTLYDSFNFGTFLQAYALSEYIKSKGYQVVFIENKKKGRYLKWIKTKNISKMIFRIGQAYKYGKSQRYFPIVSKTEELDAILIGSDEIWNIKNATFEHHKRYFGYDLNSKNIIAYAPSCNNVSGEDLKKYYNGDINFKNFDALSVRDESTKKLLQDFEINNFAEVLDPTFLKGSYQDILVEPKEKDYILVYGYDFKEEQKQEIISYAKKYNKKLISIGLYQEWCDKNVKASPYEFLGYMKNADKIVTSTFHGSVFSIIFNKTFASYTNKKKKIEELLQLFELTNRDATKTKLEQILGNNINYENVNKIIDDKRKISKEYIEKALQS